jgi:hypothetical protein
MIFDISISFIFSFPRFFFICSTRKILEGKLKFFLQMNDRKQTVLKSSAPKRISGIQFGTLRSDEIQSVSEIQVSNRELF